MLVGLVEELALEVHHAVGAYAGEVGLVGEFVGVAQLAVGAG